MDVGVGEKQLSHTKHLKPALLQRVTRSSQVVSTEVVWAGCLENGQV